MTLFFKRDHKPYEPPPPKGFNALRMTDKMVSEELAKTSSEATNEAKAVLWDYWHNSEPLLYATIDEDNDTAYLFTVSEKVQGKILLLDFFNCNVLHSLRGLRMISKMHERYSAAGLCVVGIHSPFFSAERDKEYLSQFLRKNEITYPVVSDNDYAIWKSFENQAWPRRILINPNGVAVLDLFQEGNSVLLEKTIQEELRKLSPGLACPPLLPESYTVDPAGAEYLFGTEHQMKIANASDDFILGEDLVYNKMQDTPFYVPWLVGLWAINKEAAYPSISLTKPYTGEISFHVKIKCKDVYLMCAPKAKIYGNTPRPKNVVVLLDGKPVAEHMFGEELEYSESKRTQLILKDARLRHVLSKLDGNPHTLSFIIDNEGYETAEFFGLFFEG